MVDGHEHIAERPVDPIGVPASVSKTYINTNNAYDVAIGGVPFFLANNKEHPYKRETAQYRKQQIDQAKEPGEQTLTGWWLRSQSSFHYGAGIRYEEPIEGEAVGTRFNKSAGVEVFNIGKVTLLPDVTLNASIPMVSGYAPKMLGGVDSYYASDVYFTIVANNLYITYPAYPPSFIIASSTYGNIFSVAQDGTYYYYADPGGIWRGPIDNTSAPVLIFSYPTTIPSVTNVTLGWVKQRLIACINNFIYEVIPINYYTIRDGYWTLTPMATSGSYQVTLSITTTQPYNFAPGEQLFISSSGTPMDNVPFTLVDVGNPTSTTNIGNATIVLNTILQIPGGPSSVTTYPATGYIGMWTNDTIPIYVHPNAYWQWTGVCEGPNAIYVAGYGGDTSTVMRLALDTTTGQVPLLTRALTAADMPKGEVIYALGSYISKYMVFCTNKGIRVGTIDTSGFVSSGYITYGPLTVVTSGYDSSTGQNVNFAPSVALTFDERFAYCAVTGYIDTYGDGSVMQSGLIKIDLSRDINTNQMAYSTYLQVPSSNAVTGVAVIGQSGKLVIGGVDGVWEQSDTLVPYGYIQTGQIRYFTLEDKHFELVKLRETLPMQGSIGLSYVDANGATTNVITVDSSFDFTQDITIATGASKESIALRFSLYSASGQTVNNADSFNGYQLKAVPAVARQRIITLPLENFDYVGDRYNMRVGYDGMAAEKLTALEALENSGEVITLQDFLNGETVRGIIETISFVSETPPNRKANNFSGILQVQFRTI